MIGDSKKGTISTPTPSPTPDPGNCSGTLFSDSLNGTGDAIYYSYSGRTNGTHSSWLEGPGNADFDLALQKKSGKSWNDVSVSQSSSSSESIDYNGSRGKYRWKVYAYSGSGSYDFCVIN